MGFLQIQRLHIVSLAEIYLNTERREEIKGWVSHGRELGSDLRLARALKIIT